MKSECEFSYIVHRAQNQMKTLILELQKFLYSSHRAQAVWMDLDIGVMCPPVHELCTVSIH